METEKDIASNTKTSLFWNTVLPGTFQIYRFSISIVIARLLEPKDFGIMGIASIVIFYSNSLSNFGLSTALVQKKDINKSHIDSVFTVNLIISLFLVLMTCGLSGLISRFFNIPELKNVLIVMSSIFIFSSFYIIPITILRRRIQFKEVALVELYRGVSQTVFTLTFIFLGFGYWSLVGGIVLAQSVGTVLMILKTKWIPRFAYSQKSMKEIFNFSLWSFLLSQVYFGFNYIDKFIIGRVLGPVLLGYYDKSFSLAFMPVENIAQRIGGVMFSSFSRNQENPEELKRQFLKAMAATSLICFPILFGLTAMAPYFVIVLLGEKWRPMIPTLQILSLAFTINALIGIIGSLNVGVGNQKVFCKRRIYVLLVLFVSCSVFAPWGMETVAIIVFVTTLISFVLSFDIVKETIPLITWSALVSSLFPALSGGILMLLVLKAVSFFVFTEISVQNLIILTAIGAAIYGFYIFLIDFEEARFLKNDLKDRCTRIASSIRDQKVSESVATRKS